MIQNLVSQVFPAHITARKRSLRQGNVFTPVCHSVHGGRTCVAKGACVSEEGGVHGKGACMERGGGLCAGKTATESGGTHPTGMHSY